MVSIGIVVVTFIIFVVVVLMVVVIVVFDCCRRIPNNRLDPQVFLSCSQNSEKSDGPPNVFCHVARIPKDQLDLFVM